MSDLTVEDGEAKGEALEAIVWINPPERRFRYFNRISSLKVSEDSSTTIHRLQSSESAHDIVGNNDINP